MKIIGYTPRTYLREWQDSDAEPLFRLNADPDVIRWTGDKAFDTIKEAQDFQQNYDHFQLHNRGRWMVVNRENDQVLGWCGLKYHEDVDRTDIGFRFFKGQWNKGYATETSKLCMEYAFRRLALDDVIATAVKENKASLRVINKLGMTFEAEVEGCGNICERHSVDKYSYYLQNENTEITLAD